MQKDDIDHAILGILKNNARTPISHIADTLGISRINVSKRIERMEYVGLITGYTIKTKLAPNPTLIKAWVHIRVDGNKIKSVTRSLSLEPAAQAVHSTNGKWDLLVELEADHLAQFDQTLDRIRGISGIASSETSILLSTYKS